MGEGKPEGSGKEGGGEGGGGAGGAGEQEEKKEEKEKEEEKEEEEEEEEEDEELVGLGEDIQATRPNWLQLKRNTGAEDSASLSLRHLPADPSTLNCATKRF